MLGYLDNCVRRNPARNANDQGVKALLFERRNRRVYLRFFIIVCHGENRYKVESLALQRLCGSGAFSDNYVNGSVYLAEADKSEFCHIKILSDYGIYSFIVYVC